MVFSVKLSLTDRYLNYKKRQLLLHEASKACEAREKREKKKEKNQTISRTSIMSRCILSVVLNRYGSCKTEEPTALQIDDSIPYNRQIHYAVTVSIRRHKLCNLSDLGFYVI